MESKFIVPITHSLNSTVKIPGSKSLTNRTLLIAALAEGRTIIKNALFSDDSKYFIGALQTLGFELALDYDNKEIIVNGLAGAIPAKSAQLFIGNAGTAARFISAFLTLGEGEYILDGDSRMRHRPIGDLVYSLRQLGATVNPVLQNEDQGLDEICPPVRIVASGLPGGQANISGEISSQFLSALLMVSPYARGPIEINVITTLNSKPYVDMTLGVMADFGINIQRNGYQQFRINQAAYHSLETYSIEPDASAASYFFAAPSILGGTIRIDDISFKSKQGDIAFLNILRKMGCDVVERQNHIEVNGPRSQADFLGVDVDMSDIPDTAQTLAAIAPFASTPTHIHGIASARVKESDRVSATCTELRRLGVNVVEYNDGMSIYPCEKILPSKICTYNDHRMAMAFSLVGLKVPGIQIENPGCVSKTFPDFFEVLDGMR